MLSSTDSGFRLPAPTLWLSPAEVEAARNQHFTQASRRTQSRRERAQRAEKHPVEDFLWTYYPFSAAQLERWHPGWQTALAWPEDDSIPNWYCLVEPTPSAPELPPGWVWIRGDAARFLQERREALIFITRILYSTRPEFKTAAFNCFGLHEWAMVYGLKPGEQRHEQLPLRLSQNETDHIVRTAQIHCTHYDAFRFFTPGARNFNSQQPTRNLQLQLDNPACLHANMDIYKWVMKLAPLLPSEIALAAFDLALAIRQLDMEASPYDVRSFGLGVVAIETAAGKAEYVRRQRTFSGQANALRERVIPYLLPLMDLLEITDLALYRQVTKEDAK